MIVDKGLTWIAVQDTRTTRRYVLDCPHATTELRLYRDNPLDDIIVLSSLVERHQQAFNSSPDCTTEQCGCEPKSARLH